MRQLSRREFVAVAAVTAAAAPVLARKGRDDDARPTAEVVVERIKQGIGVPWSPDTVDTFKAGDPSLAVKGVVTTAMATMDVLRSTVKAGANMVITGAPTFYGKADTPTPDPVGAAKKEFIEKNKLVIWRFSDHWRLRTPNPYTQGLCHALGWPAARRVEDPARISIASMTLEALAARIKRTLHARGGVRVIGDRYMTVQNVGVLPGSTPLRAALETLPVVDVIIAGEVREWESVEYVRDAITAGGRKGLIAIGRILSEEQGMKVCAQWLRTIVPQLAVTWIPVGDPYWRSI